MGKRLAVVQSNYIPWKGYFDLISMADEFILYDDMQYTRRDWRNRNKIKTPHGLAWLTIPVEVKGKYHQAIKDTRISDRNWPRIHWSSICQYYSKAYHYKEFKDILQELYQSADDPYLSQVNYRFLKAVCELLEIKTSISRSMDYDLSGGKTERLVDLCKKAGATEYISGPAAKGYLDQDLFQQEHIKLTWMDYSGYPEYEQIYPPFEHGVSIVDLILNTGTEAKRYLKRFSA